MAVARPPLLRSVRHSPSSSFRVRGRRFDTTINLPGMLLNRACFGPLPRHRRIESYERPRAHCRTGRANCLAWRFVAQAGRQRGVEPDPLWYKDAIMYEVHVRAFHDANGDGIGDFHGLTEKLDYLQDLGVTALWLLPFYPSPWRDDGYDISDYTDVHPVLRHPRAISRCFCARRTAGGCASSPSWS